MSCSQIEELLPVHITTALSAARDESSQFRQVTESWLGEHLGLFGVKLREFYEKSMSREGPHIAEPGILGFLLSGRIVRTMVEGGVIDETEPNANLIRTLGQNSLSSKVTIFTPEEIADLVGTDNGSALAEVVSDISRSACVAGLCFLLRDKASETVI